MQTKHFLIIVCLFCASMGFAQNKIFEKYADMNDVTSIYISKAMFQMMSKINTGTDGVNIDNLKGKIESLQLVATEKPDKIAQMKKDFSQFIKSVQYQELMRIKDESSRVHFYSVTAPNDQIKELIMLIEDENDYTAILLTGNFTLKDIQDITNKDK